MQPSLVTLAAVATGVLVAASVRPVLRRLPEPADRRDKIAYDALGTGPFVLGCALLAAAGQAVAWSILPLAVQPLWTVLAVAGVLLAAVDARTTWLPLSLTRASWVLMLVAAALAVLLGASAGALLRTLVGAAAAGLFYLLVWRVTRGGFGFGDVRYAPLLGAATAAGSWSLLLWGLTLGTLVGGLHGAARLLARKSGGFPYAPSMLAGCYLAVLALPVLVPSVPP